MKHGLYVLSGPSGVGKGTLAKMLAARGEAVLSISCTTRAPRPGEANGRDYHFVTREEFRAGIARGGFYEYSEHFGNYYGTPKEWVKEALEKNDVLLEIDVNGGLEVKKSYPSAILIFLEPPSPKALRERLVGRGAESEEKIEERLARLDYEYSKKIYYDYVVVNDDLERAYAEIAKIIDKNKGE